MKVIIFLISFYITIIGQEQQARIVELYFGTSNIEPANSSVKFNLNAIGQVWEGENSTRCEVSKQLSD